MLLSPSTEILGLASEKCCPSTVCVQNGLSDRGATTFEGGSENLLNCSDSEGRSGFLSNYVVGLVSEIYEF